MVYLADVFEAINNQNLKLQERNAYINATMMPSKLSCRKLNFESTAFKLKTFCHSLISMNSALPESKEQYYVSSGLPC
jgi:hypothetical protein